MTQVAIADALGLSNEHVCRTLSRLTAEGRIAMKGHRMTVLNPRAVMMDAGNDGSTDLTMQANEHDTMAVAA
jgi:DNA-binding IclR family transcriptional regulator